MSKSACVYGTLLTISCVFQSKSYVAHIKSCDVFSLSVLNIARGQKSHLKSA